MFFFLADTIFEFFKCLIFFLLKTKLAYGPLVSMNKSHSFQLYCNMHAKQFKLLAVWLNSVLALRAPAKRNSRVSRLLHVCVYYKYC